MECSDIPSYVEKFFNTEILPSLMNYIRIPNSTPAYDPNWAEHGLTLKGVNHLVSWVENQGLKDANVYILQDGTYTPFIYIEIAASKPGDTRTLLFYGHYDKQGPSTGWSEGLGPYTPVIRDGKLYGRGSSDDGYAIFAAVGAVKCCQDNGLPLPRIVICIEGAEESNEEQLRYYITQMKSQLESAALIVCLDSGCFDYKRMWVTSSLRGAIAFDLKVEVLSTGIHSGTGGGLVPDSYMIARQLIDRIQNQDTGEIIVPQLNLEKIPEEKLAQIIDAVEIIKDDYLKHIPLYNKTEPMKSSVKDLLINATWKPSLTIHAADIPDLESSTNMIYSATALRLSIRIPPLVDENVGWEAVKTILTKDPPFGAKVSLDLKLCGAGWDLQSYSERLNNILATASKNYFEGALAFFMEGGSIPFIDFFNKLFPKAELAILGLGGMDTNAHGPDENLDIDACKKFIMSLAYLISEF